MWLNIADLKHSDVAEEEKSEPNVTRFEEDPRTSSLDAGWDRRIYRDRDGELCESQSGSWISEEEQRNIMQCKKKKENIRVEILDRGSPARVLGIFCPYY